MLFTVYSTVQCTLLNILFAIPVYTVYILFAIPVDRLHHISAVLTSWTVLYIYCLLYLLTG